VVADRRRGKFWRLFPSGVGISIVIGGDAVSVEVDTRTNVE